MAGYAWREGQRRTAHRWSLAELEDEIQLIEAQRAARAKYAQIKGSTLGFGDAIQMHRAQKRLEWQERLEAEPVSEYGGERGLLAATMEADEWARRHEGGIHKLVKGVVKAS